MRLPFQLYIGASAFWFVLSSFCLLINSTSNLSDRIHVLFASSGSTDRFLRWLHPVTISHNPSTCRWLLFVLLTQFLQAHFMYLLFVPDNTWYKFEENHKLQTLSTRLPALKLRLWSTAGIWYNALSVKWCNIIKSLDGLYQTASAKSCWTLPLGLVASN